MNDNKTSPRGEAESLYACVRLGAALLLMTIGGAAMYGVVVALPAVQAHFVVTRADASLPYTLTMIGFGVGGILMGRLADRFGVIVPVVIGALSLGAGFLLCGMSATLWQFSLAHGLLAGLLGCAATFAPLVADTSMWFTRRRGMAVAICASGNYLAGAVWPPVLQHFFEAAGWRVTYIGLGVFCLATMLPLALLLRKRPPLPGHASPGAIANRPDRPLGLTPNALLALLSVAGLACCVAMSMPQVHIVAYCGDLGYGARRGRRAPRRGADGDAARHGRRRLGIGRDLRSHGLLPRGLRQRHRLEPPQHDDRLLAAPARSARERDASFLDGVTGHRVDELGALAPAALVGVRAARMEAAARRRRERVGHFARPGGARLAGALDLRDGLEQHAGT